MAKQSILLVVCASAVILGITAFLRLPMTAETPVGRALVHEREIRLDGIPLKVAIADTSEERSRGLSGITSLTDSEGMLFIFEEEGIYSFWMKDMVMPIDILWISSDNRVVSIEKSASPDSFPAAFTPTTPAQYVLEVRAGFSDAHGIDVGSSSMTF